VNHVPVAIMASLLLMVGSDCREREKPKKRWEGVRDADGGIVLPLQFREPYDNCVKDCRVRNASPACDRCCLDQDYLCELRKPHDISLCKGSR